MLDGERMCKCLGAIGVIIRQKRGHINIYILDYQNKNYSLSEIGKDGMKLIECNVNYVEPLFEGNFKFRNNIFTLLIIIQCILHILAIIISGY